MHKLHKKDIPSDSNPFKLCLLLMLAGDIELNPGPIDWPAKCKYSEYFPCGICECEVDWSDIAVECDECKKWYHRSCISMPSALYDDIHENDKSWLCFHCHSVNNSSVLYHVYNVNTSNSFDPNAGIPGNDSVFHQQVSDLCSPESFAPTTHSSPANAQAQRNSTQHTRGSSARTPGSSAGSRFEAPKVNNLRIVVANVNSIKGKKAEIAHLCASVKPDLILVSESKLDSDIKHTEFLPAQYTGHIRKDHTRHSGGVMIVHKKDLVIDELEVLDSDHHDHIVWARISLRNTSPMYIGSYYRSNSCNNKETITALKASLEHIRTLTKNNPKVTIIAGGDFNAKDVDWDSCSVKPGASHAPLCEAVIATLQEPHLEQLQKSPTRQDSILDLYCTNKPGLVKSINLIPGFTAEGHEFIVIDSWITAERLKKAPRKFFMWSKANWTEIKAKTTSVVNEFLNQNQKTVQDNYTTFCDHIQSMLDSYVPHGFTRTRTDVPWLTRELKRKCGRKPRMYNKAKRSK